MNYTITNPNDSIHNSEQGVQDGLTKREYFAGLAMQGLLTRTPKRHNEETDLGILEANRIAEESVHIADKLIEALNTTAK
jgi:hypothetical protein